MQSSNGAVRLLAALGRAALPGVIAALPLALLALSAPAQPAGHGAGDAMRTACDQVYDAGACRCAIDAMAAEGMLASEAHAAAIALSAGGARVEAIRVSIAVTPDLVRLVQSCMSGAGAPAD